MSVVANKALVQRLIDEVLTQHNLAVLDESCIPTTLNWTRRPAKSRGARASNSSSPRTSMPSPMYAGRLRSRSRKARWL